MAAQVAIVYLIYNQRQMYSGLFLVSLSCVKKPLRNSFFVEFVIVRAKLVKLFLEGIIVLFSTTIFII